MAITTKSGDGGKTEFRGKRVPKDSAGIEALGNIDELQAFIAEARHGLRRADTGAALTKIARELGALMGSIATETESGLAADCAEWLETEVGLHEAAYRFSGFCLPGATPTSAKLDVCRTVCRRAERSLVALAATEHVQAAAIVYLNRLSDYLFLAARAEELP
jgi:cob(I)alamin adenosyltransferase